MRWLRSLILISPVALVSCAAPGTRSPETLVRAQVATESVDHLTLAAEHMQKKQDDRALPHLRAHVRQNPQAVMIRAYLAELQLRLGLHSHAKAQFERFLRDAADATGEVRKHFVHVHTRLMEIAQVQNDPFAEKLHRGVALFLLVQQWERDREAMPADMIESTLVKAAKVLREAREDAPDDPQASLYLAEVLDKLGQPAESLRALAKRQDAGFRLSAKQREELTHGLR